jgi:hypothetical protein
MYTPNCKARVFGDQYVCDRCQVCWDLDDNDPPSCEVDDMMESLETAILYGTSFSSVSSDGRVTNFPFRDCCMIEEVVTPEDAFEILKELLK